jgi:hypothetical protein
MAIETLAKTYEKLSKLAFTPVARATDLLTPIRSALPGISDKAWSQFVRVMITAQPGTVGESNEVGMFSIMPRRLEDLGVVSGLSRGRASNGRTIWAAEFVEPLTSSGFLKSVNAQYRVFSDSMRDYFAKIMSGEIAKDPAMSLSGALCLLHRAGPKALSSKRRFSDTQAAFQRADGIF